MRDGIHQMLLESEMCESAKRRRRMYQITKNAPWINTEFGYYSLDQWKEDKKITGDHDPWEYDEYLRKLFFLEDTGEFTLNGANWEAAEFYPRFECKQLEDRGEKEVYQDEYGRSLLVFKKSHTGYMPEYIDHPVHDLESWEKNCAWRMDPTTKERYKDLEKRVPDAIKAAKEGKMITQRFVGGYMYLRSLIGPEDLLYMFYDDPDLIHTCMEAWFQLADAVSAYHQQYVTIDELFFGEDITYNQGPLISPDMIREFLFPYYQRLINNVKKRQLDPNRKLYIHCDSDGKEQSIIPLYAELGFNVFSPFEVASGCDVVEIGKEFPDIIMSGGIDKRMFSATREELKEYLDHLLPVMKARGGYFPTCDHGVPAEAEFENYCYYRKRCVEQ